MLEHVHCRFAIHASWTRAVWAGVNALFHKDSRVPLTSIEGFLFNISSPFLQEKISKFITCGRRNYTKEMGDSVVCTSFAADNMGEFACKNTVFLFFYFTRLFLRTKPLFFFDPIFSHVFYTI